MDAAAPGLAVPDVADLLVRAALDAVSVLVLTTFLYGRRHRSRNLVMVYVCFNAGLFAALTMITAGQFSAGIGFGLFGVLSIIRLRSTTYTSAQIGYFFIALVLALVNGLADRDLRLSIGLDAALLIAVYLTDHPALHTQTHTTRLVLARAYHDSAELRAAAQARLGLPLLELKVLEIDDVRDVTRVAVRYERPDDVQESSLDWLDTGAEVPS